MSMSADAQPRGQQTRPDAPEAPAAVIPIDRGVAAPSTEALDDTIAQACRSIAPLWKLESFVAVNPFLGLSGMPFDDAARYVDRVFHARMRMPSAFYLDQFYRGRIGKAALREAARAVAAELGDAGLEPERWVTSLVAGAVEPRSSHRVDTLAETVDREEGSDWSELVVHEVSKWCAARFDAGQAAWSQPDRDLPLFSAWRSHARIDRTPELRGLEGFRSYVAELPDDPRLAIAAVLAQLRIPESLRADFLARQLASVSGWAGHVQWQVREAEMAGGSDDSLVALLAVRLAFDGAIDRALGERCAYFRARVRAVGGATPAASGSRPGARPTEEIAQRIWQRAYERSWSGALVSRLGKQARARTVQGRPKLQAVFCIDVRSERLRRHLEQESPEIQTLGFAGFFGFPFEYLRGGADRGSARCPALIAPGHRIAEQERPGSGAAARDARARARHERFDGLGKLAVGAYPLVETVGHFFGLRLLTDGLGLTRPLPGGALFRNRAQEDLAPGLAVEAGTGLSIDEQVDLAEGALRGMALTRDFADVVLLCGHGSTSTNNPYASSLDCGACGGHRGDLNARVAAAVLDSPAVRLRLKERGIEIPAETVFVAGLHDTTLDEVRLLDDGALTPEQRAQLQAWLDAACAATRKERSVSLGGTPAEAHRLVRRRARDWSEIRPEWGLAGNAAFIAASRTRTRALDLQGRAFLHDYEPDQDPEGAVLEQILSAPLVVASWINLQYYASTTDNEVFGSGNKALHNVVGRQGVVLGNRSDLRVGLPWQSVHDGTDFVHEPMRLTAIVEAPRERIEACLARQDGPRELLENGWLQLLAWDADAGRFHRFVSLEAGWEPFEPAQEENG